MIILIKMRTNLLAAKVMTRCLFTMSKGEIPKSVVANRKTISLPRLIKLSKLMAYIMLCIVAAELSASQNKVIILAHVIM
jgi:hypothetical protein